MYLLTNSLNSSSCNYYIQKRYLSDVIIVTEGVLAVVVFPQDRHQQIQRLERCASIPSSHVRGCPDLSKSRHLSIVTVLMREGPR